MSEIVSEIAVHADGVDVQSRPRCRGRIAVGEQRPVRALEQIEQPMRLACRALDLCVGRSVAGDENAMSFRCVHRQGRRGIADIELMRVAPSPHLTTLHCIEQVGCETEHSLCHGAALRLVGVEQCVCRAAHHCPKLPGEIVRILHAGVEALPTGRRMGVRCIADEEHAADAVTVGEPRVHVEGGCPGDAMDKEIIATGPLAQ